MKAAFFEKFGSASEVLSVGELPDSDVGRGEGRF